MRLAPLLAGVLALAACRSGSSAPPPCGELGEACCATGEACGTDLRCDAGICQPCGASGQACCTTGAACGASLNCVASSCEPCGTQGLACCTTGLACGAGLECAESTCLDVCRLDKPGITWLAFTHVSGGNYDVDLVHDDGTCRVPAVAGAATDNFPAFSPPDLGLLVFSSTRGGAPGLYTRDLAAGTEQGVPVVGVTATAPRYSPDGIWIAFEGKATSATRTDVYRVLRVGGQPMALTGAPGNSAGPVYSPDGSTVYLVSNRAGAYQVYAVAADGGTATLVSGTSGIQGRPALSPDGTQLAFTRINASSVAEVAVKDLVGGGVRVVSAQGDADPCFDATGARLAVSSSRGGDHAIWILDASDGGNAVRVTTPSAGEIDGQPAFRP
ncbi:MAG: hypothetical protein QM767_04930 [Anaeromyxobacter sp.]